MRGRPSFRFDHGKVLNLRRCRVTREVPVDEHRPIRIRLAGTMRPRRIENSRLEVLALKNSTSANSKSHGIEHWRRVAAIGRELAAATPGAEPEVVDAFAMLHDACRTGNPGADSDHGPRAAALARTLPLGFSEQHLETLCQALADHTSGTTSDDPTIGCCWDADRLDLTRLDRPSVARLLSTEAARTCGVSL
jgi:uncharacterized protein